MPRLTRRATLRLAGAGLLLAACGEQPVRRRVPSPIRLANLSPWGVNTFLEVEVETWKRRKSVKMIAEAGIHWIKQQFPWADIEIPAKGEFFDARSRRTTWDKYDEIVDLADETGLEIIARVDHAPAWARPAGSNASAPPSSLSDYAAFLEHLATRYQGRVRHFQIWNEPNLAADWGGTPPDPRAYARLLRVAFETLKSIDDNIVVIAAPMAATLEDSPRALNELVYLERLYALGAGDWLDVQAANAFGLEHPPTAPPDPDVLNFRRVELIRERMTEFGLSAKPIWFNEYGWNASPADMDPAKLIWRRVDEPKQAEWTVSGVRYGLANWPWAGVFNIWFFRRPFEIVGPDESEYYFRMVGPDFTPRLVYRAVQRAATGHSFP